MKQLVDDENTRKKLSESEIANVSEKCEEVLSWIDNNNNSSSADVEEFEEKKRDFENICRPIMSKLHGEVNQYSATGQGPNVEEVD